MKTFLIDANRQQQTLITHVVHLDSKVMFYALQKQNIKSPYRWILVFVHHALEHTLAMKEFLEAHAIE
jgi:hypothetical protein